MGTRSTIALEFADGTIEQVYCHWDGYLENNGQLLNIYYMDPFEVRALIDLGDFSSLRETADATKETAYSQRGEDCTARRYMDLEDYEDNCQQEEYDYILRNVKGQATWYVRYYATNGKWISLEEAFLMKEECVE